MAFHEAFKQLQARTLQTKLKSTATVQNIEEGVKTEPSFGPWGITQESSTAIKSEGQTGGRGLWRRAWSKGWDQRHTEKALRQYSANTETFSYFSNLRRNTVFRPVAWAWSEVSVVISCHREFTPFVSIP